MFYAVVHLLLQTVEKFQEQRTDDSVSEAEGKTTKAHCEFIVKSLEEFESAPFTLQRICELILKPSLHYTKVNKLLYGIEKLVSVSTTLEPAEPEDLQRLSEEMAEVQKNKQTFPIEDKPAEEKPKQETEKVKENDTAEAPKKEDTGKDEDTEMKDVNDAPTQ